uniref:Uncharacterized protein n=1 Tax=Leptospira santarosai serovar Arenal str. MAVJ 401 TaxID=1049976 RepID=M6JL83_9LEPT|nr:hypothetical protein LEP1GSC063_4139 [Leptospira santarosai serovar Arenal str. MAVJ 401]
MEEKRFPFLTLAYWEKSGNFRGVKTINCSSDGKKSAYTPLLLISTE